VRAGLARAWPAELAAETGVASRGADTAELRAAEFVFSPGLMCLSDPLHSTLAVYRAHALIVPRTATKTRELSTPLPLGTDLPGTHVTVTLSESLPPSDKVKLKGGGRFLHWFEHLEGDAPVRLSTKAGQPAIMGGDHLRYLAGWPDDKTFDRIISDLCAEAGVPTTRLPEGLRIRDTATHRFVFNYAPHAQDWNGTTIPAGDLIWQPLT